MAKGPRKTNGADESRRESRAADADDGQIVITSDGGSTLSLYTWHQLTAEYKGSDQNVKSIGWAAQQVAPPSNQLWGGAPVQILVSFDPPRSELSGNKATTKVLIYGAFNNPGDEALGVDIYARVLETDVTDVPPKKQNFPCTVPPVPSGNVLALDSVEGDPVVTGEAFHFFVASCSTYDGNPPGNGSVEWSARIVSDPPPADAQIQLITDYIPGSGSTTLNSLPAGAGPAFALNGLRVISSEPVLVEVMASTTHPGQYTRTIQVQFQPEVILPHQALLELYPTDIYAWSAMPWLSSTGAYIINDVYNRPGVVSNVTTDFWWPFLTSEISTSGSYGFFYGSKDQIAVSKWAGGNPDRTGMVVARSLNPQTGTYDYGSLPVLYRDPGADVIRIAADQTQEYGQSLYAPRKLNGWYTGSKTFSQVTWSVNPDENPEYRVTFDPNLSSAGPDGLGNLYTTTQMTVTGPNRPVTVTAYARSTDGDFVTGLSYSLTFYPVKTPLQGNAIELVSLDGDTLKESGGNGPEWHLLKAIYRQLDGTAVAGSALTWSASDPSVTFAQPTGGKTDADGVMTNVMKTTRTDRFSFTVTVSADGTSDTITIPLTFQPEVQPLPGQDLLTIASSGGLSNLEFDTPYPLTVNSSDPARLIAWTAFPSDRLTFTSDVTLQGVTNYVKASPGPDIPVAVISARAFHAQPPALGLDSSVGIYDYSEPDLVLSFGESHSDALVITAESPPSLYSSGAIDGTYAGDKTFTHVEWSVDPDENPGYAITFDPNPSQADPQVGGLKTTTNMTVYGPNAATTVTVYAHSTDGDFVKGVQALDVAKVATPPQTGSIELVSLAGNPLAENGGTPLIQATYRRLGSRVIYEPLDWEIVDAPMGAVSLLTQSGETDVSGVMTNGVKTSSTVPVTFTVRVASRSNPGDSATLTLTFQPTVTPLPGQGSMEIQSANGQTLTLGSQNPLSAKYTDGDGKQVAANTDVAWAGFPSERLIFDKGVVTETGEDGTAPNVIRADGGTAIADAVVMTTHFNKLTGTYDYGYLPLSFETGQTQGLSGIMIDKSSCVIPVPLGASVDPTDPTEVIRCQVKVSGVPGAQTVTLFTAPDDTAVAIYDASNYAALLPPYSIQTDPDTGLATVLVGSTSYNFFSLGAQWQEEKVTAPLVIVRSKGGLAAPTVPQLRDGVLQAPPSPAPTFQVFIPATDVVQGSQVALTLNNRVVWQGSVDPNAAIEVAYAALDFNPGASNTLIYVTQDLSESLPAGGKPFVAQGTPQTGPNTGGVKRSFGAPIIVTKTPRRVTPQDIVGAGLPVYIQPYGAEEGDMITVYAYLAGDTLDLLSGKPGKLQPTTNILAWPYQVLSGDPLLSNKETLVNLPQWALAGYTDDGQLQIDVKVVPSGKTTPLWSLLSRTFILNTTFS